MATRWRRAIDTGAAPADTCSRAVEFAILLIEFGRTFRENGNRGTDHGHGSAYWVLGGGLHGGRVAGEQVKIEAATLFQNRDFPVLNDYRRLLGGLFARLYGLNAEDLSKVFPGAQPLDLSLL